MACFRSRLRAVVAAFTILGALTTSVVRAAPDALRVYPTDSPNPTKPFAPPTNGGAKGKCLNLHTTFTFPLAPLVEFSQDGNLTVALRGGPERPEQNLLSLRDASWELEIVTTPASDQRRVALVLRQNDALQRKATSEVSLPATWSTATLAWSARQATLKLGAAHISLELPNPFRPQQISVLASRVDELNVRGHGEFRLDWEDGYAATVTPPAGAQSRVLRPQGFDNYFVSLQPNRRDTPCLQVINASNTPWRASVRYRLKSEVGAQSTSWTQEIHAPARSSALLPINFPHALASDIYHLNISCSQGGWKFEANKHFLYVERRNERPGSPKLGLHDSDRRVDGFWPDALPIRQSHFYVNWGYVVGPAWLKDYNGNFGLDPDTPSAQWYWNSYLDGSLAEKQTPLICIGGVPMQEWQREKPYPHMKHLPFGDIGGKPNEARYRQFVHEVALRYKGRVPYYEIENEPNAHHYPPEDYLALLKAAYEEIKAVDNDAKVFGISGTGDFVPWMNKVFELGGWQYMDGVSIHTYTTPRLPEAAGLPEKLAQVRALIRQYKPSLELFNTETGTYVAPREEVDRPIPPARLQELIDKYASPTLAVSSGWPNYALDETTGSLSIVRNATYNLAAGAKRFIFFGWNPQWPNADWWTRRSYGGWQLISATKDGKERTPNLYTLAMGVLSAQLEPALTDGAAPIDVSGVRGAIFKTANGGSVAVAWSLSGTRTAAFRVGKRRLKDMDVVSLFGQKIPLQPSQLSHGVLRVELGEQPMYLHLKKGLLRTQASPFGDIKVLSSGGGRYALRYSLSNRSDTAWKGKVEYSAPESWNIEPQRTAIRLDAGQSANFSATVTPAAGASGTHTLTARLQTPDGENYTASFAVQVHPTLTVTATNIAAPLAFDAMPSSALLINRLEQVTIGRAAGLASLQDPKYWLGPDELSAQVKTEYSAQGLSVAVRVHDVNFRPPTPWPGVGGSAVELFFDFRRPDGGLGSKHYGNGVYQFILKPPSKDGDAVNIWFASGGEIAGAKASGTRIGAQDYTVQLFLPWKELGVTPTPNLIFGMDVAVDGAASGNAGRKSQIVLFGTADNFQDASTFALASLNFNPLKGE